MNSLITTVTVKLSDGNEYDIQVSIPYTVHTWQESRGQHFGTPCSETMSSISWDLTGLEWSYCGDTLLHLVVADPEQLDFIIKQRVSELISDGTIEAI